MLNYVQHQLGKRHNQGPQMICINHLFVGISVKSTKMDSPKYHLEDPCQHPQLLGHMTEESHNVQTLTGPVLGSEDLYSIHLTILLIVMLVHRHLQLPLEQGHHRVGRLSTLHVDDFIYSVFYFRLSTSAAPRLFTPSSNTNTGHRKMAGSMSKLHKKWRSTSDFDQSPGLSVYRKSTVTGSSLRSQYENSIYVK